jgi:ribonuclease H / adenosylcobalamin/alpha-ribazole phosphatase
LPGMERLTTVLVVRHGRTALNAQGRFRGRQDPPLDEVGLAEVEETAASIAARPGGRPVAAIATSPLARARQTAETIGLATGREPFVLEELNDLDHGAWSGLTAEEARERDPQEYELFRRDPRSSVPPGGESLAEVERRMRGAIASLAARYPGEDVVAVSHEIPIRLLLSGINEVDGSGVWDIELPTASVNVLVRGTDGDWAAG